MPEHLSITNSPKGKLSRLPFAKIKNAVLGRGYALSVVFAKAEKMRALNRRYRRIGKPTDILSFPLSKNAGEIFLCLAEAKKEAPKFGMSFEAFVPYLFIHGCLHLSGLDHGEKMDKLEKKYRARFGL